MNGISKKILNFKQRKIVTKVILVILTEGPVFLHEKWGKKTKQHVAITSINLTSFPLCISLTIVTMFT